MLVARVARRTSVVLILCGVADVDLVTPLLGELEERFLVELLTRLAYNEIHSSTRMSIERAFGMLCRKWLLLKRPFEGSLRRTRYSAGVHVTVVVAMKLHNASIK